MSHRCHDCGITPADRVGLCLWAVRTVKGWIQLCGRCALKRGPE